MSSAASAASASAGDTSVGGCRLRTPRRPRRLRVLGGGQRAASRASPAAADIHTPRARAPAGEHCRRGVHGDAVAGSHRRATSAVLVVPHTAIRIVAARGKGRHEQQKAILVTGRRVLVLDPLPRKPTLAELRRDPGLANARCARRRCRAAHRPPTGRQCRSWARPSAGRRRAGLREDWAYASAYTARPARGAARRRQPCILGAASPERSWHRRSMSRRRALAPSSAKHGSLPCDRRALQEGDVDVRVRPHGADVGVLHR